MQYTKQPLSVEEQISKLEKRGLHFCNKDLSTKYLQNISYYRLRAFTYPFQNNTEIADHEFIRDDIDFMDIIDLYVFDKRLRSLVFSEIEKIEVALRTKLSLYYSLSENDALWYENENIYKSSIKFQKIFSDIKSDVDRSDEEFIKHYRQKYDTPLMPPSWMTLEVVSFGILSRLYNELISSVVKRKIANQFGIGNERIFANWLHAFNNLRNCCAHHSRIWNRRFLVQIKLPYNTTSAFIPRKKIAKIRNNKLFAMLSAIKYVVDIISPDNSFKANMLQLLNQPNRLLSLKEMGFPPDWETLPVWK
ncbi:MAG: Abi family protein [Paludibacteraceae bacterium]|nr:Abi family protein [Paludibacteraceae bacterium]MEE3483379.1 Abi family protein [Bacteroidales bacterium]